MYIKSGDIVIMSGDSRKCYHGIPKIVHSQDAPWSTDSTSPVTISNFQSTKDQEIEDPPHKRTKLESVLLDRSEIIQKLACENFWEPFSRYIQHSRINMNVRQVLFKGDTTLDNKGT